MISTSRLTFLVFEFFFEQVSTMERPLSHNSTCVFAYMSELTGFTPVTHAAAFLTCSKKNYAEREVAVKKVIGPAASIATDRSTLSRFSYSLQRFMNRNDGLNVFLFIRKIAFSIRRILR